MDKCPMCLGREILKARNDCGHFKATGMKPLRMYQYRCSDCGFVATYAKDDEK
jgi:hypothetical protein